MRVGIIGAGNVARFHMQGYLAAGAEVVAVADADTAKAGLLAEQAGAQVLGSYHELLAKPEIEAVSVCLPNNLHYQAAKDALAAGKHVLCEKPMTTTLAHAQELAALVASSGKRFQTAYMKRYLPAFRAAREAIDSIGTPVSATVKVFHWFPDENWAKAAEIWGLSKERAGGGPLVHAGSHILDILNWWFGPFETASARVRNYPGLDVDQYSAATLMSSSGVTVFFECGWYPLSHIGYFKDGWDERIEVTGERGRVELYSTWWDRPEMSQVVRVYREGQPTTEMYLEPVNGFVEEVKAFVESASNGKKPTPDVNDGLAVQELIEAIYQSSERGSAVSLKELR